MTEDDTTADNGSEPADGTSNGTTTPAANTDNGEPTTPTGGGANTIRPRGSKVSNLRAAFEQSAGAPPPPLLPRSLSGNVSKVAASNDAEVTRLKEALAKEQEDREADRQRLEELQIEIEELRQRANTAFGEALSPDSDDSPTDGQQPDSEKLALELHTAKARSQAYENELDAVRSQLAEVKRSIAVNTRIETHEMTDSAFQGEFGTLCYLIQDWVINSFRKSKVEKTAEEMCGSIDSMEDEQRKQRLRPIFETWEVSSKLVLLQSAIVASILPVFEDPMPFGLPTNLAWSGAIKSASDELEHVLDPAAYNRWRATTFDIICHSEVISPFVHSAANRITNDICELIQTVCGITTSEAQIDALRNIVRRVIALSHSLRVQRANYDVRMPLPGSNFDSTQMEAISGDHDDMLEQTIQCSIFPAVYKMTSSSSSMVLIKARVFWKESWD